jgi:crossover junction endodeoxyribonuclease RuvC
MTTSTAPIILGIDPGYDRVGWCVGSVGQNFQLQVIKFGCIQTSPKQTLLERYQQIDTELTEVVRELHPTEAAVESLFFTKNQKTAMHVSEARGVIISCLFRHQVQFFEYTPLQIKQAVTGYGKADKAAVEKMVRLQLGSQISQQAGKIIDDTLDAMGIALTHMANRKLLK